MATQFERFTSQVLTPWSRPNCVLLESVDSTNRLARELATSIYSGGSEPTATWVLGYEQTAGRGRLGRSWQSNAGTGIYATLLLPICGPIDAERLLSLPIAVGVATCRAMASIVGPTTQSDPLQGQVEDDPASRIGLKWPNDLLFDERKLAGILIEVVEGSADHRCAAIGIGVNHGSGQASLPHPNATSLRLIAESCNRPLPTLAECAVVLCNSVFEELDLARSRAELLADYQELSVHRCGDRLKWTSSTGLVEGVFDRFDVSGRIVLQTEKGTVKISAGDVLLTAS